MKSRVHPKYKTKYRVRNWASYERALIGRGNITIWLSRAAIAAWKPEGTRTRGAPPKYSDLAIETALTLRLLVHLPRRQAEGVRANPNARPGDLASCQLHAGAPPVVDAHVVVAAVEAERPELAVAVTHAGDGVVLNERSLHRILRSYIDYYHLWRTHLSLGKDAPVSRRVEPAAPGEVMAMPHVGGLHHSYHRHAA